MNSQFSIWKHLKKKKNCLAFLLIPVAHLRSVLSLILNELERLLHSKRYRTFQILIYDNPPFSFYSGRSRTVSEQWLWNLFLRLILNKSKSQHQISFTSFQCRWRENCIDQIQVKRCSFRTPSPPHRYQWNYLIEFRPTYKHNSGPNPEMGSILAITFSMSFDTVKTEKVRDD